MALDTEGVRALAAGAPIITDDHNRLATVRFASRGGFGWVDRLFRDFDPLKDRIDDLEIAPLMRRMNVGGRTPRARALLTEISGAKHFAGQGFSLLRGRSPRAVRKALQRALELDPERDDARVGLILVERGRVPDTGLTPREQTIAAALRAAAQGEFASIQEYDAGLAAWQPGDILYEDALRLRVDWRIATGDAALAQEALEMNTTILYGTRMPRDFLQRARAAQIAGNPTFAWGALEALGQRVRPAGSALARQGLEVARRLPDHDRAGAIKMGLRPRAR